MSFRVVVPNSLRELTEGEATIRLESGASTVGGALEMLREAHPSLYERMVTEKGEVRPHVNIFVGGEDVRWTGGMDTPIADGGEVVVLPSVSGG